MLSIDMDLKLFQDPKALVSQSCNYSIDFAENVI